MVQATEPTPDIVRPLSVQDLPDCLALTRSAHWNQHADDWSLMLRIGQGWGVELPDPAGQGSPVLAASAVALPFRHGSISDFAWISMVLVLPAFRGRGLATRLMQTAIGWARAQGLGVVLDATPQGMPVYARLGMAPHWSFHRYRRPARPFEAPTTLASRPIADADWPTILATDRQAFGGCRAALLRDLAARKPTLARIVVDIYGRLKGYGFGRNGHEAVQIGPLWADDDASAATLLT